MLELPAPDLRALAAGEVIVAFAPRSAVGEGDEVELVAAGTRAGTELKPAYARWAGERAPDGDWAAVVEAVHPASALDPERGAARHVLATAPTDGDLLVLRVYAGNGDPVLSDTAFAARVRSLDGALR